MGPVAQLPVPDAGVEVSDRASRARTAQTTYAGIGLPRQKRMPDRVGPVELGQSQTARLGMNMRLKRLREHQQSIPSKCPWTGRANR